MRPPRRRPPAATVRLAQAPALGRLPERLRPGEDDGRAGHPEAVLLVGVKLFLGVLFSQCLKG